MGQPTNRSSGLKTADATIVTGKSILAGVQIITDKTNDATVVLYDNTSAAGTEIFKAIVTGTDDTIHFNVPDGGISCDIGIYADITVAAGAMGYIVLYR